MMNIWNKVKELSLRIKEFVLKIKDGIVNIYKKFLPK
jgi:hypothetical protein